VNLTRFLIYSNGRILAVLFSFIAALFGIFLATQPIGTILIGAVAIAFIILAAISPLATIMVLLVLSPMRTLIATEASLQLPLDIGQIALAVALTVWIFHQIARGERLARFVWSPVLVPIFVFVIAVGVTAFAATSLTAWLNEWLKWVQVLILVVFALNYLGNRQWEWLLFGLMLSGVANALVGIYEFFGGSGAPHLLINDRFFRAFGTFGQPNPFGGFMGLLIPVALMATLGYGRRVGASSCTTFLQRFRQNHLHLTFFYAVSSAVMLIAIGMSWSRGAWIGLAGALAVIAFAIPRNTRRGIILFGSIVGLLVLFWSLGVLPRSVVERLENSTQEFFAFEDVRGVDITPENYAVAERLAHWQAALNMATAHPWLGVGLGNYEVVYPIYRLLNWQEPLGHAHNFYLNILAEAGIIGLLVYGKVWVVIISLTWRARRHPDILSRLMIIGLLGSWMYLTIHSFFDNLYVNNLFLHLGLMLGILAVLYNQTQTQIKFGVS
jgi:O-antigen ligase